VASKYPNKPLPVSLFKKEGDTILILELEKHDLISAVVFEYLEGWISSFISENVFPKKIRY